MPRRTIRKPTRWTAEEWSQVEDAARECGVPPLRYVREAALGRPPAPRRSRRVSELQRQLARVLNNLRQLERVAEIDGEEGAVVQIGFIADMVESALRAAGRHPPADTAQLVETVQSLGTRLNEIAHRANATETLPGDSVLRPVLITVHRLTRQFKGG